MSRDRQQRTQADFARFLTIALTTLPLPAFAAWPHDPTINLPIAAYPSSQFYPEVAPDGSGGAYIAWFDSRSGVSASTYVQHVSATGVPLWTPGGIDLHTSTRYEFRTAIVADGTGGVIVAWQDFSLGPTISHVYVQRLDAAGTALWHGGGPVTSDGVPVSIAGGEEGSPVLVADGTGGVFVTWTDSRVESNVNLYAQHFDASGNELWTANGVPVCTAAQYQVNATADTDGAGGIVVAWQDGRTDFTPDIYAQRVDAFGAPSWTVNGVIVCSDVADQFEPKLVSDGANGAVITWSDLRTPANSYDVYAQRVNGSGAVQWTANGIGISTTFGEQNRPRLVSDGAGGAIVAWEDFRLGATNGNIYGRRVTAAGSTTGTANGTAICTSGGTQWEPVLCSDGEGGAIVTWNDERSPAGGDLYAQRMDQTGVVRWAFNGVAISTASIHQQYPSIAPDGTGGAILAWNDYRDTCNEDSCGHNDVFAQRVDRFGKLGNPEPFITIADVATDQGGFVKVSWAASYLDSVGTASIGDYQVFLSTTDTPSWALVGSVTATLAPSYQLTVSTPADSTPGSPNHTRFRVDARSITNPATEFYSSRVDSGYSVDNLAPPAPMPLSGEYLAGTATLHWSPVAVADLAGYRLYRALDPSFTPGPGNLIASPPDTGFVDVAGGSFVYRLTAHDVHGNESPSALWAPVGTVDVGLVTPGVLTFAPPAPNPARGQLRFEIMLPRASHVRLALYSVTGRRVALVHDGPLPAGPHALRFGLEDGAGRSLSSGIYVARLEADGQQIVHRVATMR